MVTGKKLAIHSVILTLIILSVLIVEGIQKNQLAQLKGPLFENFAEKQIAKIEFTHGDSLIVLKKQGEEWFVNSKRDEKFIGYQADSLMIKKIFDKMPVLKKEILSGSSKEAAEDLKVTPELGIHVKMFDAKGTVLEDFLIGKKAKVWSNSYLRKSDEKKIYSVGENIRFAFKGDLLAWRQKKIVNVDKEAITFIHFNSVATGVMNIGQSPEKTWHIIGDTIVPLDDSLMAPIFKEILAISATNWVYDAVPDTDLGFINPSLTLGFELSDGKKIALIVGNKEADRPRYYVKSSESEEIFYMLNAKIRFMIDNFKRAKEVALTPPPTPEIVETDSTKSE